MSSEAPPIRKQYLDLKRQYPHAILFFRLGDFYETFDADAELVARELDIVLTSREYTNQRVPMAGVPHHAVEAYMAKLIAKGYHVAICEQIGSEPIKGLFPRRVTRVVTPGTVIEPGLLTEARNNYLAAIVVEGNRGGLAFVDITTGHFTAAQFESPSSAGRGAGGESDILALLRHELTRLSPAELLVPDNLQSPISNLFPTSLPQYRFDPAANRQLLLDHFGVSTLAGFGVEHQPLAIRCAGAILHYLRDTRPNALNLLVGLGTYSTAEFMLLDSATRRNLELTETIRGGQVRGSLLGVLDKTVTPMGARLLRVWVNQPLLDVNEINARLDLVNALFSAGVHRAEIRAALKPLGDLERLVNRVLGGTATPRDVGAIRAALAAIPNLKTILGEPQIRSDDLSRPLAEVTEVAAAIGSLSSQIDPSPDIHSMLCSALAADDLPANLDHPGVIRPGWSAELDGVVAASKGAREWIAGLEKTERERSGLKTLKVGFNKVFGYYIEISKAAAENAPANYIRKQTLVNAERFITPDLKEYETLVLNAEERMLEIEARLFKELCAQIGAQSARLLNTARALARLDVFASLAEVAANNNYARPTLVPDGRLEIRDGRHPVVEHFLSSGERYVPNDVVFEEDECVRVITGPNMSGKCICGDTLVFTNAGVVPIESLQPGEVDEDSFAPVDYTVKSLNGYGVATHFYRGGRRETIRLRTRLGYEIEGTPEHRIWARPASGDEGWKPLAEIAQGDFVAIDRRIDLWGSCTTVNTPKAVGLQSHNALKLYSLPTRLTPDLAYVMGLLIGDGSLRERQYLALTTGDAFIRREFSRIVREQFGYRVSRVARSNHFDLRIGSLQIRLFFEELGLGYDKAIDKRIPATVLRSPRPIVAAFLQGLFDTDGYADLKGSVSLSTSSPVLARQVHTLLLNFGIVSSLQPKKGVRSTNPAYQVYTYGAEAEKFYGEIGFRLPRKQARAKLISPLRMPNVGGIPHLSLALKQVQARIVATPDKPVALKRNKSINSIFYTYLPNNRNISYFKLDELVQYCQDNGVDFPELMPLAKRRYFYEPVTKITSGGTDVFDFSVQGSHSFVANGFVNHNSTYLRQSALITLMAQIGSFVPASAATIGIVDRIFTRIGAEDVIHAGQSTFMVEMVETANILHHATKRSLLVLDEIGRGTSTYDGLSLAWAIIEYIHSHPRLRAKTLFATHYHELVDLANLLPGVRNYNVAVTEDPAADKVVFLHRIIPGGADRSYGIHVAQMAGLPKPVINRAQELLAALELSSGKAVQTEPQAVQQIALFPETNPLLDELKSVDISSLTPLEALNKLFEWQRRFGDSKEK